MSLKAVARRRYRPKAELYNQIRRKVTAVASDVRRVPIAGRDRDRTSAVVGLALSLWLVQTCARSRDLQKLARESRETRVRALSAFGRAHTRRISWAPPC